MIEQKVSKWSEHFSCAELDFRLVDRRNGEWIYSVSHVAGQDLWSMQRILRYLECQYARYKEECIAFAEVPRKFNDYIPRVVDYDSDNLFTSSLTLAIQDGNPESTSLIPLMDILDAGVTLGGLDLMRLSKQCFELLMFCSAVGILPVLQLANFGLIVAERRVVLLNWLGAKTDTWLLAAQTPTQQIRELSHSLLLISRAELGPGGRWRLLEANSILELIVLETLLMGFSGEFSTATDIYVRLSEIESLFRSNFN